MRKLFITTLFVISFIPCLGAQYRYQTNVGYASLNLARKQFSSELEANTYVLGQTFYVDMLEYSDSSPYAEAAYYNHLDRINLSLSHEDIGFKGRLSAFDMDITGAHVEYVHHLKDSNFMLHGVVSAVNVEAYDSSSRYTLGAGYYVSEGILVGVDFDHSFHSNNTNIDVYAQGLFTMANSKWLAFKANIIMRDIQHRVSNWKGQLAAQYYFSQRNSLGLQLLKTENLPGVELSLEYEHYFSESFLMSVGYVNLIDGSFDSESYVMGAGFVF